MKRLIAFILTVFMVLSVSCGNNITQTDESEKSEPSEQSIVSEVREESSEDISASDASEESKEEASEEPIEESSEKESSDISDEEKSSGTHEEQSEERSEEELKEESLPHEHTESVVKGKAATCTEEGLTDGKVCSECGEILVERKAIKAKGHTESVVKGKAATCTEEGLTDGKVCSECGETLVERKAIEATGKHTFENGVCTYCGKLDPDEKLDYDIVDHFPIENRAVWYRAVEKSDGEVTSTIKLMSEMGINTVYLEAWYHGHVIGYSDNPLVTHYTKAHGDYDAMEGFCRIAHSYGIEVHAWVENFYIGPKGNNCPNPELIEATKGHHLLDSKGRDYGPTVFGDFVFLNANDEFCQNLVLDVYVEMIEKYDIDGLHLDYIRFPDPNPYDFGYNEDIIEAFQTEYNTTEDPHTFSRGSDMWKKWCVFRENIINKWVEKVYNAAKAIDPNLSISCAVMNNYPDCRTSIFQNFASWVDNGNMDEVIIMSYCGDLQTPENNIKTFLTHTKDKCFLSAGLSAFESTSADILNKQIALSREKAYGSSLFAWGNLIVHGNDYFHSIKQSVWRRKAVRTDKGSETVKAYFTWLLEVLKVKSRTNVIRRDFCTDAISKIQSLLSKANATDFSSLDKDGREEYVTKTVSELQELRVLADSCTDEATKASLIKELDFLICCIRLAK